MKLTWIGRRLSWVRVRGESRQQLASARLSPAERSAYPAKCQRHRTQKIILRRLEDVRARVIFLDTVLDDGE